MGGIQALSANLLAPPDGTVQDIASLVVQLKEWASNNRSTVEAVNLIVGFGYDPAQLAEQRHPTREDLDAVSTDFPVYIVHQSGHIGVTNSKGLEVLELNAASEDVPGGVIRRGPGGDPDGVLEGNVHFSALGNLFGSLGQAGFLELGRAGTKLWASYGFKTAQEGRAVPLVVDVLNELAELQELEIDVAVYPDVMIFPEGTRRPVGAEPKYKYGITHLYKGLNCPVVPIAHNAGVYWPRSSWKVYPGTVIVDILPPIEPGLAPEVFYEQLVDQIEAASDRLIEEARQAPDPSPVLQSVEVRKKASQA